jgi:enterochelin esterase-like enzyme
MPASTKTSRTQLWFDSLGEWSWPGRAAEAVEALPPVWVPAFPPRLEPVAVSASAPGSWQQPRAAPRMLGLGLLLSALAALCAVIALNGPQSFERAIGLRADAPAAEATVPAAEATVPAAVAPQPLPTLVATSHDKAGSSIDTADYSSTALAGAGSFHVYLPPGYADTTQRYPVLYLLHGNEQPASAFLELGLQGQLDTLIARHEIPPLIAVMIQGGRGTNNWRDQGTRRYESYVVEVQELIDRMLPTVASRGARAIAGDSMGGYGAMNIALAYPERFSVVESWLGFFNGLEGELRADRPILSRRGLDAFVYGAESDVIANPSENAPFAAALRAAGASATSAVYPGDHSLETIQAHLGHMLAFAGGALSASPGWRAAAEPASAESSAGISAIGAAAGDARAGSPNGGP